MLSFPVFRVELWAGPDDIIPVITAPVIPLVMSLSVTNV